MQILEAEASKSQTTKLWVDVLIKPVLLTMMGIPAEREDNEPLHLASYNQMMPYFDRAGYVNHTINMIAGSIFVSKNGYQKSCCHTS
jgi:hypothetical protein